MSVVPQSTSPRLSDYLLRSGGDPADPCMTFEGRTYVRSELCEQVDRTAARLGDLGVGPGSVVAVSLANGPDLVAFLLAVWEAGAAVAPLNPLLGREERARLLERLDAALFVGGAREVGETLADRPVGGVAALAGSTLDLARPGGGARAASPGTSLVLHTSGTTGPPKAVELAGTSIMEALDSVMRMLGAGGRKGERSPAKRGSPNLIAFPLSHLAGLYNLLLAFRNDREVLLMRRFEASALVDLIEQHRLPSVVLNPTMIYMLVEDAGLDPGRLSSLRFVRSGSAPLPRSVVERFYERFGVPVLNCYGQTETSGEVIGWTAGDLRYSETKLGSVGRPHPGVILRFVDDELSDVPPGDVGELCVRAPFVARRYLVGEASPPMLDGGFLRTGDLGYLDADGFVWLVGRRNDVVSCGGFKVLPEEVEEVLRRHPSVLDVMVAGLPDERLGEAPHAFVVPRPGAATTTLADELREHVRGSLAHYKAPRAVHLVEGLPRNAMGKLMRSQAADLLPPR